MRNCSFETRITLTLALSLDGRGDWSQPHTWIPDRSGVARGGTEGDLEDINVLAETFLLGQFVDSHGSCDILDGEALGLEKGDL